MRGERSERIASFKLRHAFGETPVNERLRLEDNLSFFDLRLKNVADGHADHIPDVLGDDYLVFIFNGDNGHCGRTVQLFIFTLAGQRNPSWAGSMVFETAR